MKFLAILFLSLMSCTVACAQMKKLSAKQNKILLQSVKASDSNKHASAIQLIEDLADKGVTGNSSYHFFANSIYYNYFVYSTHIGPKTALPALDKSLHHLGVCDSLENAYQLRTYAADNKVRLEQTLNQIDSYANALYKNSDYASLDQLSAILRTNSTILLNKSPQANASLYKVCDILLQAAIQNKSNASIISLAEFLGTEKNISKENRIYLCKVYQENNQEKSAFLTALHGITEYPSESLFVDMSLEIFRNSKDRNLHNILPKESSSSESNIIRQLTGGCSYYYQQQYNEAYEAFKTLISSYSDSSELYSLLADSCLKSALMNELSGRRDDAKINDALSLFLRVREMSPHNKSEWVNGLYTIYQRLQKYDKLREIEDLM